MNHTAPTPTVAPTATPTAALTAPALLPVCGAHRTLPDDLAPAAAALAPHEPHTLERELRCVLQAHTAGPHHALALDLPGADTGAVWAAWRRHEALHLAIHPDCPALSDRNRDDACCAPADHPGAHTYDLADPWRPAPHP